jgi:hypothetical protein
MLAGLLLEAASPAAKRAQGLPRTVANAGSAKGPRSRTRRRSRRSRGYIIGGRVSVHDCELRRSPTDGGWRTFRSRVSCEGARRYDGTRLSPYICSSVLPRVSGTRAHTNGMEMTAAMA